MTQTPASGPLELVSRAWENVIAAQDEPHRIYESLPEELLAALDRLTSATVEHLSAHPGQDAQLQELFFEVLAFCRLAADFDSSTLFEITRQPSILCLRNLVPGRFLAPRFTAAHTSVLFSATLAPHAFFRDILGLPQSCEFLDVQSPFHADQLARMKRY